MESNKLHHTILQSSPIWKLIGAVLFSFIMIAILFVQTNRLLGQEGIAPAAVNSAWDTAVIFPNSIQSNITHQEETEIHTAVPGSATNGNVYVNTDTGTSNTVPFQIEPNFVPTDTQEATTWNTTFSGALTQTTTWNSHLLLTGDVIVPAGITLTIDPGTTIFVTTNSDDQNGGEWNDKTELQIFGTLLVNGTESDPVYFTSNATNKAPEDWGGIQIRENSTTSQLTGCMIRYAIDAVRFQIYRAPGGGDIWATVQNCTLQYNQIGIHFRVRPGFPDGDNAHLDGEIRNNLITYNTETGIQVDNNSGFKDATTDPLIFNNVIENNNSGVIVRTSSWWEGHVDDYTSIINNTIRNNTTYGIFVLTQGSSDDSGSDTVAAPIIENNLLNNNATNILLGLDPRGNDGIQDFQPTVRYNSLYDAPFGIVISDTQPFNVFTPTITLNVFKRFSPVSDYAIANTSSRTVNVSQNYWGATPTEWDIGMPSTTVTGTVNSTSPLDSNSPPLLTRFASSSSQNGDNATVYGANFGAILKVYLPTILNQMSIDTFPVFIGDAIPQRDVSNTGENFYSTSIQVPTQLPTTGNFYLSSNANNLAPVLVDDEIVINLNNAPIYSYDFSTSGIPQSAILSIPRVTVEQMAGQSVTVEYYDVYGHVVTASEMWLIWVP